MSSTRTTARRRSLAGLLSAALVTALAVLGLGAPATAAATPTITVTPSTIDPTQPHDLTVTGTGFVGPGAAVGAYVLFGKTSTWSGTGALPSSGWEGQIHVPASAITDGSFTATFPVPAFDAEPGATYHVATSAAHWLSVSDRTMDTFFPVTVEAPAEPEPEPTPTPEPTQEPTEEPTQEPTEEPTQEPTEEPTQEPTQEPTEEPTAAAPAVSVFRADGTTAYDGEALAAGEKLVVTGTGFLPAPPATSGSRPPLAGQFTGAYVAIGSFLDTWKPTENAPASARKTFDTRWGVHAAQIPTIGGTDANSTVIAPDGTFTTTLTVPAADVEGALTDGNWGIYTYPGGGAKHAPFETATPLTLAPVTPEPVKDPKVTVIPAGLLDPAVENVLTVNGTGFVGDSAANGAYVLFGETSVWSGNGPLPSEGWVQIAWVPQARIVDGTFTTTVTIPAGTLAPTKSYQVATSAAHGLSATDRTLDTFTPVAVKQPTTPVDPTVTVTVSGGEIRQGGKATFTGTGFVPGETVHGVVRSEPVTLADRVADLNGTVVFTWDVPAGFPTGNHTVTLTGDSNRTNQATFTVAAATATPPAGAQCQAVTSGSLTWGVKQSFRAYITGPIARGSWTTDGVTENNGAFTWSNASGTYSPDAHSGEARLSGSVAFSGHGGQLALTVSQPRVQLTSATTGLLLLDVSSKALDDGAVTNATAVPFATLTFPAIEAGSTLTVSDATATLTAAGAEAFAGFYAAGSPLDPVSFTLSLGQSTDCVPPTVVDEDDLGNQGGGNGTGNGAGNGAGGNGTGGSTGGSSTGSTGGSTGSSTPAGAKCVAQGVGGGSLSWGVKSSFRTYVTGPIAHGSINVSGVTQNNGVFTWGGGSGAYNEADSKGRVSYSGTLHFTGHNGQLDLKISNLRVQVTGKGSANLVADISSKGLNAPDVNSSGVVLATLALPASSTTDGSISWKDAPATLTAEGAKAFGGFYQGGTAMDPVSFSFPLGGSVECDSATGTLATTGADDSSTLALGATGLLLLGAALVAIRRRRSEVTTA